MHIHMQLLLHITYIRSLNRIQGRKRDRRGCEEGTGQFKRLVYNFKAITYEIPEENASQEKLHE